MADKTLRKATAERHGSLVVIRMTGGPDCLWLNMYLDTQEKQMTCDSDIGFYAYHWGRHASMTSGFIDFCTHWLADDDWLLRKCIGERNYTPWQKRFAEISREVIVPELRKLVTGDA